MRIIHENFSVKPFPKTKINLMLYFKGFQSDKTSKTAQSVKVPVTKPNNLSLIPRTNGIRREVTHANCPLISM